MKSSTHNHQILQPSIIMSIQLPLQEETVILSSNPPHYELPPDVRKFYGLSSVQDIHTLLGYHTNHTDAAISSIDSNNTTDNKQFDIHDLHNIPYLSKYLQSSSSSSTTTTQPPPSSSTFE